MRRISVVVLAAAGLLVSACQVPEGVKRIGEPPTPHERYARSLRDAGLAETALGREWLVAADTALRAALPMSLPFREVGYFDRSEARAFAWQFAATEGQRISIAVGRPNGAGGTVQDTMQAELFVDLYEVTGDTTRPFRHRTAGGDSSILYEVRDNSTLVLRVQPELLRSGRFEVSVRADPLLAFPVEGRGNSAVQSFFGAARDGGRREHHGIDIFAPRGTPVLAAANGYVRSTTPSNLGGNVVWLSDTERGQSIYYAHLDRASVAPGQYVRIGDTVGFVGNTGNARTTAPHLHFGIYRRGRGPIDPWPYVRIVTATAPALRADTTRLGVRARARTANTVVRQSPVASAAAVTSLSSSDTVWVMGAAGNWFRVHTIDGSAGYVPATSLR